MFKLRKVLSLFWPSTLQKDLDLGRNNLQMAFNICPANFGRALVIAQFIRNIGLAIEDNYRVINIAVIGGYLGEPELEALKLMGYATKVDFYGIEKNDLRLDLNQNKKLFEKPDKNYDLILCSQVWEHIWNHGNAFDNIIKLMSENTYLWLACPTSNRSHSSPFY